MQIRYNVTGEKRKAMVAVMRDILQETTRYLGPPSFGFQVGAYTVDKNGTVTCPDDTDPAQLDMLMRELAHDDFIGERIDEPVRPGEQETGGSSKEPSAPSLNDIDRLEIELPMDDMTPIVVENLIRLVASKAMLLKKALGTDSLPITEHEDRIEFGWFRPTDDQTEIAAYYQLVQGLCKLAQSQQRVNAKEQIVENERYALRCFLLRLGFIGVEYKDARKILLKNLSGSAAFKGVKETGADA
jgi:hypothetical protein